MHLSVPKKSCLYRLRRLLGLLHDAFFEWVLKLLILNYLGWKPTSKTKENDPKTNAQKHVTGLEIIFGTKLCSGSTLSLLFRINYVKVETFKSLGDEILRAFTRINDPPISLFLYIFSTLKKVFFCVHTKYSISDDISPLTFKLCGKPL